VASPVSVTQPNQALHLTAAAPTASGVHAPRAAAAGELVVRRRRASRVRGPAATLQRYADGLASGLLTVPEVTSSVLEMLAESADRVELWASAPAALRRSVLAYVAEIGAANVPPMFWIGPGESDPARRAARTVLRREIAAQLLADAEPGAAADRGGI